MNTADWDEVNDRAMNCLVVSCTMGALCESCDVVAAATVFDPPMTVAQLVAALMALPQDAEVYMRDYEYGTNEVPSPHMDEYGKVCL